MDPITLGLMLGGTALSAVGKILGGFSEAKSRFEQAAMSEQQAQLRIEKGEFDVRASNRRFTRFQGEAIAGAGTTGVDMSSFLDVFNDDAAEHSLEKLAIRYTAANEASQLRTQGRIQREAGKDAITGGYFGAAAAVVNGYATYRYNSAKLSAASNNNSTSSGVSASSVFDF
jgi:hypothetical protein